MGFVKFLTTFLLIIALFSSSIFASGFEISGVGTKARGMAGAFRGVADDWSAAYYNPAGYAFINDNQLGANSAFYHYRHQMNPEYTFGGYEFGFYNKTNYNEHEILSNPSAGFLVRLPVWGEVSMGFSAFQLFDNNITWQLYDLPEAYNNLGWYLSPDQYKNNLDVVAFQFTIAKEFTEDKFAMGLGIQLLRGDLIYNEMSFRDNLFPNAPLGVRPWDKISEWNYNDGNGYGFGINFGMMFKPNDRLSIGVNAKVPFDITISGTSRLEFYMPKIFSVDSVGFEDPGNVGTVGNLFIAGNLIADTADFETKLQLPASFGLGLAYDVNEKLKVALDLEYTLWSKFEGFDFAFTNHRGLTGAADTSLTAYNYFTKDMSYPYEWKNAGKVALGATYIYNDRITFLAGVSDDQSPSRENSLITPQFMDTGDKITISGGALIYHKQWEFGLITSYTDYPELQKSTLIDLNGDGLYDNLNGTFKGATYETIFSFIYRF